MLRTLQIHVGSREAAADPETMRRRGLAHQLLGVGLLAVAEWGLWRDVPWVAQPFYAWVWWGYILVLDGFCARRRGDSLLTRRRHLLLPICTWSVTFWFVFELINARINNWYYVGVYSAEAGPAASVFTLLAFATVFMGIFQTYEALTATGLWNDWKGRVRHFRMRLTYFLQFVGVVMGGVALLFPHYLAPLVWGSFTLIVDPWNYRRGTRSLLRDLENGDYGLLMRLLLAGLACGVVWESLNFFAPQKWIYTVRGLEHFKLFEMPLLGFLGFPALALDTMAAYALAASIFLGNRTWERDGDLSYEPATKRPLDAGWFWASLPVHVAFWGMVSWYATPVNIASLQVELEDLGLRPAERRRLEALDIERPRQFIRRSKSEAERAALREELDWSTARFREVRDRARLYTFKGIGRQHGRLLERVGVRKPGDLRGREPKALHEDLMRHAGGGRLRPPRLDFVRVWVLAAENGNRVILNGRSRS